MAPDPTYTGRYARHLPAALTVAPGGSDAVPFLVRFLLAFERILSGLGAGAPADPPSVANTPPGIEQVLDRIQTYFLPQEAPEEFLPWLAGWVATSLRADWPADKCRKFLAKMMTLYKLRGTRTGLEQVLAFYTELPVTVSEQAGGPGEQAHYFIVEMTISERDPQKLMQQTSLVCAVIDQEKPAHTFYSLKVNYPPVTIRSETKKPTGPHLGAETMLSSLRTTSTAAAATVAIPAMCIRSADKQPTSPRLAWDSFLGTGR